MNNKLYCYLSVIDIKLCLSRFSRKCTLCSHFMLHITWCTTCDLPKFLYIAFPPHPTLLFNTAGLLVWVHTCHLMSHVAGWVGLLPHFGSQICRVMHAPHSLAHPHIYRYLSGCDIRHIRWLIHYLQGALLRPLSSLCRVCCYHPLVFYILQGVLLPP